jgi:hypothetical protein
MIFTSISLCVEISLSFRGNIWDSLFQMSPLLCYDSVLVGLRVQIRNCFYCLSNTWVAWISKEASWLWISASAISGVTACLESNLHSSLIGSKWIILFFAWSWKIWLSFVRNVKENKNRSYNQTNNFGFVRFVLTSIDIFTYKNLALLSTIMLFANVMGFWDVVMAMCTLLECGGCDFNINQGSHIQSFCTAGKYWRRNS